MAGKYKLIVMSGFSGSGKGTILEVSNKAKADFEVIKSYTTRKPRSEQDFYEFVSRETFSRMEEEHKFLETNCYTGASAWYGTPIDAMNAILSTGKTAIAEIDCNGFHQIREKSIFSTENVGSVFIVTDADSLYQRLVGRGSETNESLIKRLKTAVEESHLIQEYDIVIVNDDIEQSVYEFENYFYFGRRPSTTFDPETFRNRMDEIIKELKDKIEE